MPDTVFAQAYRIVGAVGEGAMGTVYRATRLDDGSVCALKTLRPSIASDQHKAVERFSREARVGEQIGNPHIVDVLDTGFDTATGLHWLTMEFLEGLPLGDYLSERPPDRDTRLRLIDELFSAMAAAHRAGVIHRDLKPDNLFVVDLDGQPTLKVLDFGVAKTLREGLAASATEGGLGTPLWTAPEQGKGGDHIRPSVDVWALGLLAFYVLTGKIYWRNCNDERASMLDIAKEMLRDPIEPAGLRAEQLGCGGVLPAGFDAWFARCVVREVDQRFADAGQADRAWRDVLQGRAVPASAPPAPPTQRSPPPAPPSKRALTAATLAALILGLAAPVAAGGWLR